MFALQAIQASHVKHGECQAHTYNKLAGFESYKKNRFANM